MVPPTTTGSNDPATSSKSLKNVRSGHLSHLTKLVNQIEEAMSDLKNVKKVLQLQGEVTRALKNFQASSREYAASLTDAADVQREVTIAKNQEKANAELNTQIVSWIRQGEQRNVEATAPSSRPREIFQPSTTPLSEPERNRRRWQLELAHETRRQDENRVIEEANRAELLREHERKTRLREITEEYEKACLEVELVSDEDSLTVATGDKRVVTFADEIRDQQPVQLREYSRPSEDNSASAPNNTAESSASLLSSEDTRVPYSPAANQLELGVSASPSEVAQSPAFIPPVGRQPIPSLSTVHQSVSPQIATNANGMYTRATPSEGMDYHPRPYPNRNDYQTSAFQPYNYRTSYNYMNRPPPPPPQQHGYVPIYSVSNNPHQYPQPFAWPHDRIVNSLGNMADAFMLGNDLPKPDIKPFSGDPREFYNFKNAFMSIIETKTTNDRLRLHFLVQYCTGAARQAIEYCQMFSDPRYGLMEAKAVLANTFGQTYDVIQAYKTPLLKGPSIKPSDTNGLLNLSLEMRKCNLALSQLGFASDINNSETLLRIVWKLPYHLQGKWVSRAEEIFAMGREPHFADLTEFIRHNAKTANNFYGRNIRRDRSEHTAQPQRQNNQWQRNPMRGTTLATNISVAERLPQHTKCLFCNSDAHLLENCQPFEALAISERFKFAFDSRLCHNCLLIGHVARGCLVRSRCGQTDCRRKHHGLFHRTEARVADVNAISLDANEDHIQTEVLEWDDVVTTPEVTESESLNEVSMNCNFNNTETRACLHVVPVRVQGNGKEILTHALLDTGSDVSLCTNALIRTLGLRGRPARYHLNTINASNVISNGVEVSLEVVSLDKEETICIEKVWGVDRIPANARNMPVMKDIAAWKHLKDITFPSLDTDDIGLLIGGDTPEAFWVLDQRIGNKKEPFAVKTPLGWSLMGPVRRPPSNSGTVHRLSLEDRLSEQVEAFWKVEFSDINALEKPEMSKNDISALSLVENSVIKIDNRYVLGLPWKKDRNQLCGNLSMALTRLKSLKRRLMGNEELRSKYSKTLSAYIDDGHARMVPPDELQRDALDLWYLPHHPVVNPEKPEKLRVVFDCAASHNGLSLNKSLFSGPDLTSNLLGVLMRFRKERVALVGDITAMFHQIGMNKEDWKKLSFLWWPNGDLSSKPLTYQMKVHLFGATSSPFCANYCLRKTALDNADRFPASIINTVCRSFYVDDCLASVSSDKEASDLRNQLTHLLELGGFKINKWISNSRAVMNSIPSDDLSMSVRDKNLELSDLPIDRALGVIWDVERDCLSFRWSNRATPDTRRGVLSTISSLFDPLGVVAPFALHGKVVMQELTRLGLGWDDPLPNDILLHWRSWVTNLPKLVDVSLPRCIKPEHIGNGINIQLHHFCDASRKAYGVVSYVRIQDSAGNISSTFLMGKSRLAPIKTVSIPRLELSSATLAVKQNAFLQQELDMTINSTHYWTDSTTVLKYLRNKTKRFHTFVANRVSAIQRGSTTSQWNYVCSDDNPADDATRGLQPQDFLSNCRWLKGPSFLNLAYTSWPSEAVDASIDDQDPEVRKGGLVAMVDTSLPVDNLLERYSNLDRLLRAVGWLLRFKRFIQTRRKPESTSIGPLNAHDIELAERAIIAYVQRANFPFLFDKKCRISMPKSMRKLRPCIADNLARVGGRITHAPVDFDVKHPVIIPRGHLASLIVRKIHQSNGHVGPPHTWTLLRQRYWILCGGAVVRKVIGRCIQCKRRNSKPCQQLMADLPISRVTPEMPPFDSTGIDYFGPLLVKQGRSSQKRYGCLFTCMSSRAVHLELAADLSASAFINAFKRFISRRGTPSHIFSDNGTNFVGADRELKQMIDEMSTPSVQNLLLSKRIMWHFNSPLAPHMGGAWERMVGLVKSILKKILNEQLVKEDILHTVLLEVENILNSRPLIPVTLDPTQKEPLTPNHLLLLNHSSCVLDDYQYDKSDNYSTRRWRQVQYLSQQFWRRWVKEYLPLLQTRTKWTKRMENLKIGDLVLVAADSVPRGRWPLGRIVETYPGQDGNVRQVKVLINGATYLRPVTRLHYLELK